ncbi:MAG: hypothetical protein JWM34_1184 [Ilumatobacteraceae bacterium]|nr:hypothetical protein [Ilumatobacteraceae bacterium]
MRARTRRRQRALLVWGNWGPYHHARFVAARARLAQAGWQLEGVQMYSSSGIYAWDAKAFDGVHDIGLEPPEMTFRPSPTVRRVIPLLIRRRPTVVFVPSYWHWSLLTNVVARCVGARVIMMSDTHALTTQTGQSRQAVKSFIVRHFSAALVAGTPHQAFYESLGLDGSAIFPGYDVVDNQHFTTIAATARATRAEHLAAHQLPDGFILSLGRLVAKKNIGLVIDAFADMRERVDAPPSLVIVGEGDELEGLVARCAARGLPVVNRHVGAAVVDEAVATAPGTVHFHPYADYDQTAEYMALADLFVLASTSEEWGLVVNEAMASGTCVVVSDVVGSAPDLCIDGETGLQFPSGDRSALAAALERLALDADERRRLAAAGHTLIADWDVDRFADESLHAINAAMRR